MAGIVVPIVGDPRSILRSFKQVSVASTTLGRDLKQLGLTAEQSAKKQVDASVRRDARLRAEIVAYKQVAAAAQRGSREQVAAANLAAEAQAKLARSLTLTEREQARVAAQSKTLGRELRGGIAGSGLIAGAGRSVAFASLGFLGAFGATSFLRGSIEQATQAEAVQRSLAAQFAASGKNLADYQDQIDKTVASLSRLAGIEDDQLKAAFVTAFRAEQNVSTGLKTLAIAADVARGTGRPLETVTLGLTKAYLGQAAAARRLGIIIPANVKGMAALEFVQRRFAGQAAASTTTQERFNAAIKNTEQNIGTGLLPALQKLEGTLTKNLSSQESQRNIQTGASATSKVLTGAIFGLNKVIEASRFQWKLLAGSIKSNVILMDLFKKSAQGLSATPNAAGIFGSPVLGGIAGTSLQRPGAATAAARGPRASLAFQLSLNDQRQAQAALTASQADDRAALVARKALLLRKIAVTKDLAERTSLYKDLGSTESQIAQIDQQAADKAAVAVKARQAAEAKQRGARLTLLRVQQRRDEDEKKTLDAELRTAKQRETTLRGKIAQIKQAFAQQVDTARQGIGTLFGGPVLNPSQSQTQRVLGLTGPAAGTLTADLKGQVAQYRRLNRDLSTLGKQGASKQLLAELRGQGVDAIPQIEALTGASRGQRQAFFKAFAAREKLAVTTARTEMRSQLVTLRADRVQLAATRAQERALQQKERPIIVRIELDKKTIAEAVVTEAQRQSGRTSAQRRGRSAGTVHGVH